jgi:hypothetical protein
VIRVPDWLPRKLGRYYAYFGHHKGQFIRLAYADSIRGPWKIYDPGVLQVKDTAFFRPQPDPPGMVTFYTHVASPEILVDPARRRIVMWFHGWWTNGERWPAVEAEARQWANAKRYGQFTQSAESSDGINFTVHPAITRVSYLRVFEHDAQLYGMARIGRLLRSKDPHGAFEVGPDPFKGSAYQNRVRHVALARRGSAMHVFFSGIGDAPERIMHATMDLAGDWQGWKASPPVEVLRPEAAYECPSLPVAPSEPGEIDGPARQLRDPAIFEEAGKTFLFYTVCGEQGIAAAEVTIP